MFTVSLQNYEQDLWFLVCDYRSWEQFFFSFLLLLLHFLHEFALGLVHQATIRIRYRLGSYRITLIPSQLISTIAHTNGDMNTLHRTTKCMCEWQVPCVFTCQWLRLSSWQDISLKTLSVSLACFFRSWKKTHIYIRTMKIETEVGRLHMYVCMYSSSSRFQNP